MLSALNKILPLARCKIPCWRELLGWMEFSFTKLLEFALEEEFPVRTSLAFDSTPPNFRGLDFFAPMEVAF